MYLQLPLLLAARAGQLHRCRPPLSPPCQALHWIYIKVIRVTVSHLLNQKILPLPHPTHSTYIILITIS